MAAVDPTYPSYPIACSLATALMVLVLSTNFVRKSWNLGITFLCAWIAIETLNQAINTVVWSNNTDIKLYVYCDIFTRLMVAANAGVGIAPLLITRRLYLIATLQSASLSISTQARHWDRILEWTLGLGWPLVSAGPIYYVMETERFEVLEGEGCSNVFDGSILFIILSEVWSLLPGLISVLIYYPKVASTFYRHGRDVNQFLRSNGSVSRTSYMHVLAIASINLLLTLPIGLVTLAFSLRSQMDVIKTFPFYSGWKADHSDWTPTTAPYPGATFHGTYLVFYWYWGLWTAPVTAFVIFGLFGLTKEARTSYWQIICTIGNCFGWKPASIAQKKGQELGTIEFGERPMEEISLGSGTGTSNIVNVECSRLEPDAGRGAGSAVSETTLDTSKDGSLVYHTSGEEGELQELHVMEAEAEGAGEAVNPLEY
ncbi:unnamed protein product [Peniophora sp. CBMAI 1063]|nr:unnamed protein product [Peniophora sp. CBMAI 1063]